MQTRSDLMNFSVLWINLLFRQVKQLSKSKSTNLTKPIKDNVEAEELNLHFHGNSTTLVTQKQNVTDFPSFIFTHIYF